MELRLHTLFLLVAVNASGIGDMALALVILIIHNIQSCSALGVSNRFKIGMLPYYKYYNTKTLSVNTD